jgi:hypothetical protein
MKPRAAGALCLATAALLAATPTATALANPTSRLAGGNPSVSSAATHDSLPAPGELLAPGHIEELLAGLPLGDLSAAQLTEYLAGLEDISAFAHLQIGLLGNEQLGLAGLEENLSNAIAQLGPSATIGELADVAGLLPALEGRLNGLLGELLGGVLESKQQQELTEALSTLNLDQLVASLLAGASQPEQLSGLSELAAGLFEKLGAGATEGLLGVPLEAPFTPSTVEGAAQQLGSTATAVSNELGQSTAELPATATMLTAPLSGGKLLAVAPTLKGLALGLLGGPSGEEEGNGTGEGGEEEGSGGEESKGAGGGSGAGSGGSGQGTGGAGGQGGAGGTTTPGANGPGGSSGSLTVVVNVPPTSSTTGTASTSAAKANSAKVRILGAKTKGSRATIVLRAPAAGRLTLRGSGIRSKTLSIRKAGPLTVHVSLSRAGVASLHRRHRRLAVKLHASFRVASGATSAATVALAFR